MPPPLAGTSDPRREVSKGLLLGEGGSQHEGRRCQGGAVGGSCSERRGPTLENTRGLSQGHRDPRTL